MDKFSTIDDVLDYAMEAEQRSIDFYTNLAEKTRNEEMEQVFMDFAREEMGHKKRIMDIKDQGIFVLEPEQVADLHISDYVVAQKPGPDMDYADALTVAMQREKAAYKLYTDLASRTTNEEMKLLFNDLAQEEAKHKLRFEKEYDEYVLRDN